MFQAAQQNSPRKTTRASQLSSHFSDSSMPPLDRDTSSSPVAGNSNSNSGNALRNNNSSSSSSSSASPAPIAREKENDKPASSASAKKSQLIKQEDDEDATMEEESGSRSSGKDRKEVKESQSTKEATNSASRPSGQLALVAIALELIRNVLDD